jgi:DNA (cytosine-5)-methyltransferase 1
MNGNIEPSVISFFAGCGGSSLGYKMAGYKELLAIDFDKNAVETFKLNFIDVPIWQKDITQIKGIDILDFCKIQKGELDVLDGSPPCQGFSTAGKRKVYDERNDLVLEYIRLVDELQPKVFVMENVSGMVKGIMKGLFKEYMLKMKALNYVVKCKLLNAKYYNVPQSRQRLIFIGVRKDLDKDPVFPKGSKKIITVKETLKDLVEEGDSGTSLSKWEKERWGKIKPGEGFNKIDGSGYSMKKVNPNMPLCTAPKSIAYGGHAYLYHWTKERGLSVNEIKLLHSYPLNYLFPETGFKNKWAVIGNSVPPNFMYAIAKTIKEEILN